MKRECNAKPNKKRGTDREVRPQPLPLTLANLSMAVEDLGGAGATGAAAATGAGAAGAVEDASLSSSPCTSWMVLVWVDTRIVTPDLLLPTTPGLSDRPTRWQATTPLARSGKSGHSAAIRQLHDPTSHARSSTSPQPPEVRRGAPRGRDSRKTRKDQIFIISTKKQQTARHSEAHTHLRRAEASAAERLEHGAPELGHGQCGETAAHGRDDQSVRDRSRRHQCLECASEPRTDEGFRNSRQRGHGFNPGPRFLLLLPWPRRERAPAADLSFHPVFNLRTQSSRWAEQSVDVRRKGQGPLRHSVGFCFKARSLLWARGSSGELRTTTSFIVCFVVFRTKKKGVLAPFFPRGGGGGGGGGRAGWREMGRERKPQVRWCHARATGRKGNASRKQRARSTHAACGSAAEKEK